MSAAKERALGRARARVARLEGQLADARAQLEAVEASLREPLRGRAVADAALTALAADGHTGPIHYVAWFGLLQGRDGVLVGGEDPLATFLTAIARDERVRSCGHRTGTYEAVLA